MSMDQGIDKGSTVQMWGKCACRDMRDCYHRACTVLQVQGNGKYYIVNKHGSARVVEPREVIELS